MADRVGLREQILTYISDTARRHFHYKPLPGPDYIRILTVPPMRLQDRVLTYRVEIVRLTKDADYTALSYSWRMHSEDDEHGTYQIMICGRWKRVTRNLYDALWHIRSREDYSRLWIDAICINQSDLIERNAQVAQMGKVFENASHVVARLGAELGDQEAEIALRAITCLSQARSVEDHRTGHHWRNSDDSTGNLCGVRDLLTLDPDSADYQSKAKDLVPRLLVMAEKRFEATVSKVFHPVWMSELLICLDRVAETRLSLGTLGAAAWGPGAGQAAAALETIIVRRTRLQRLLRRKHHTRLVELMIECSDLECADPRDMVYSLVSMDRTCDITPDYTSTTVATYMDFATKLVQQDKLALLLHNACNGGAGIPLITLPSWVPDLPTGFIKLSDRESRSLSVHDSLEARVDIGGVLCLKLYLVGRAYPSGDASPSSITFKQPANRMLLDDISSPSDAWTVPDWGNHQQDRKWHWPCEYAEPLYLFTRSSDTSDRGNAYIWLRTRTADFKTWYFVSTLNPHGKTTDRAGNRQYMLPLPIGKSSVRIF